MSTRDGILKTIVSVGPITALNFVNDSLLLVGCGYNLKIYKVNGLEAACEREVRIFGRERIHGIISRSKGQSHSEPAEIQQGETDDTDVFIWGGKSIISTTLRELSSRDDFRCQEIRAPDWILHAAFVPLSWSTAATRARSTVTFVTAHNELVRFKSSPEGEDSEFLTLANPERTLLYSASVLVKSDPDSEGEIVVHVAAGTVFGVVQYWSQAWKTPVDPEQEITRTTLFHSKFISHEGSIFGVAISDDLQRIVSCSDDRSVRTWDISKYKATDAQQENLVPETVNQSLAVGWGHNARIWGVKFLERAAFDQLSPAHHLVNPRLVMRRERRFVLSWGEDATSKLWMAEEGKMTCLKTYRNIHIGKNTWSLAIPPRLHVSTTVATGGADGALSIWQVTLEDFNSSSTNSGADEVIHDVPGDPSAKPKVTLKDYCILSNSAFLASLSDGKLYKGNHSKKSDWNLVGEWEACRNSSTLASWRGSGSGLAAIGDKEGKVAVLDFRHGESSGCDWRKLFSGRIARLLTAMTTRDTPFLLSISFDEPDKFFLQKVSPPNSNQPSQVEHTWTLQCPEKFIPKSFDIEQTSRGDYIAILGSRFGALALWHFNDTTAEDAALQPVGVWRRIHSDDAITAVNIRDTQHPDNIIIILMTTGRDGSFSTHRIDIKSGAEELHPIHKTHPMLFTTIEGLYIYDRPKQRGEEKQREEVILYGFHGTDMVLWNETWGVEVGVGGFNCGSGNRSFDISFEAGEGGDVMGFFVYTRAQKCHSVRFPNILRNPQVEASFHGREVKTIAVSPGLDNFKKPVCVIATGSEDTVIRLSLRHPMTGKIIPLCLQKAHSTGILHLEWTPCHGWLFSCGGVEEVYCWKFTPLSWQSGIPNVGLIKEAELETGKKEKDSDLRVLGSSLIVVEKGFLIAFVYSDSSIKIAYYDVVKRRFIVRMEGVYKTCCLLHVRLFKAVGGEQLCLLTAGTDGYVTIWEVDCGVFPTPDIDDDSTDMKLGQPKWSEQIHQNSVKSLDMRQLPDGSILLLTGGDDTAISISKITISSDGVIIHAIREKVERAHASAVTGAKILLRDKTRVVTAGVDQRVKLWDLEVDDGLKLTQVEERFVCVPDIADMDYYEDDGEGQVAVVGVGMEILSV